MLGAAGAAWAGTATAVLGLIGALLGLLQYVNYRSKRDRIAAVGSAFETVVEALASESDVKRLAAAIRLRRFFDPSSEVGVAGAAYTLDALAVAAGILRDQPTGNFQKLLADGLAYAPSLRRADLQRTNLQGAYLAERDISRADFYRADLSHASLKRATATDAVFYQARLVGTVLSMADLRGANFFQADLTDAQFAGALLVGATFSESRSVPVEIASQLDEDGRFVGPDSPLPAPPRATFTRPSVFVSRPSALTPPQEAAWRLVRDTLTQANANVVALARTDYPPAGVLGDIRRSMAACHGIVVLGFRQLEVASGRWRPGTSEERPVEAIALATPWNQVEVGIAAALGLAVFVVREPGVTGGVFDLDGDAVTAVVDLDDALSHDNAAASLETWVNGLRH